MEKVSVLNWSKMNIEGVCATLGAFASGIKVSADTTISKWFKSDTFSSSSSSGSFKMKKIEVEKNYD